MKQRFCRILDGSPLLRNWLVPAATARTSQVAVGGSARHPTSIHVQRRDDDGRRSHPLLGVLSSRLSRGGRVRNGHGLVATELGVESHDQEREGSQLLLFLLFLLRGRLGAAGSGRLGGSGLLLLLLGSSFLAVGLLLLLALLHLFHRFAERTAHKHEPHVPAHQSPVGGERAVTHTRPTATQMQRQIQKASDQRRHVRSIRRLRLVLRHKQHGSWSEFEILRGSLLPFAERGLCRQTDTVTRRVRQMCVTAEQNSDK